MAMSKGRILAGAVIVLLVVFIVAVLVFGNMFVAEILHPEMRFRLAV